MDLKVQLDFLKQKSNELLSVITDTQMSADLVSKNSYDEGYGAGHAAGIGGGSPTPVEADPKIYTQSAMDSTVAAIRASLDAEIAALKADKELAIGVRVREEVEAFKSQLLAALQAEMAEERKLEAGVLALLQPSAPAPAPEPEQPAPSPETPAEPSEPPAPVEPTPDPVPAEPAPVETPAEQPSEPAPEAPAPEPSNPAEPSPEPEAPAEPAPAESAPAEPAPSDPVDPSPEQPSDPLTG